MVIYNEGKNKSYLMLKAMHHVAFFFFANSSTGVLYVKIVKKKLEGDMTCEHHSHRRRQLYGQQF